MERSTQTRPPHCLHKEVQANTIVPLELIKVVYPTMASQTMDDMVLDVAKYAPMKNLYNVVPLLVPARPSGTIATVAGPSTSHQAISPAFKDFQWYPERRPGHGPKIIRSDLDRTFAVSSKIVVNELFKEKEKREIKQQKEAKSKKGKVKKTSTTLDRPTSPLPDSPELLLG